MTARRILAIAAVVLASPAAAGPNWAPGEIRQVRVLGERHSVVRVITERSELDDFSSSLAAAEEVKNRSRNQWTHSLDITGPHGGRWLYDGATGEFALLSKRLTPVYRLAPVAKSRINALLSPQSARDSETSRREWDDPAGGVQGAPRTRTRVPIRG